MYCRGKGREKKDRIPESRRAKEKWPGRSVKLKGGRKAIPQNCVRRKEEEDASK